MSTRPHHPYNPYEAMFRALGDLHAGVKIAILDDYQNVAISSAEQAWTGVRSSRLTKVSIAVKTFKEHIPTADLPSVLRPYDIICTMRERTPFPAELLNALPNLKLLTTTGPVNRSINLDAARRRGIIVAGTGATGNSTAEHIWGLLLACARQIPAYDRSVKELGTPWQHIETFGPNILPVGLMGKTLGIVGFGRLGTAVAKIAGAFGMNVVAWSQNLTTRKMSPEQLDHVSIVSKSELFETSDFISVHLVLSDRSVGIIGEEDLSKMKPTAIIINTSRGPIIDEQALIRMLKEGKIRGAGIDVFEQEPLPEDSEWRKLGNRVVVTPHVGYVEGRNYEKFWEDTAWNVDVWLDGRDDYVYRLA